MLQELYTRWDKSQDEILSPRPFAQISIPRVTLSNLSLPNKDCDSTLSISNIFSRFFQLRCKHTYLQTVNILLAGSLINLESKSWIALKYFVKVRLTPNMIFGMCNIWVIRRRNVIYLYDKKSHVDQLFHCQSLRI